MLAKAGFQGQLDCEGCAFTRTACKGNGAVMGFGNALADRRPETAAAGFTRTGFVRSEEPLKHMWLIRRL
jgi:hypothetical protein